MGKKQREILAEERTAAGIVKALCDIAMSQRIDLDTKTAILKGIWLALGDLIKRLEETP